MGCLEVKGGAHFQAGQRRTRACKSVPEANVAVSGAASGGQGPVLVGRPADGLDRRGVVCEVAERLAARPAARGRAGAAVLRRPDVERVVVAARGQQAIVEGPF